MPKKIKAKTEVELAEDEFAERLARILVDQFLEDEKKKDVISESAR